MRACASSYCNMICYVWLLSLKACSFLKSNGGEVDLGEGGLGLGVEVGTGGEERETAVGL